MVCSFQPEQLDKSCPAKDSWGMPNLSLSALFDLVAARLIIDGAGQEAAASVARSVVAAEADDMTAIGLGYLPLYCSHLRVGKVDGHALPRLINSKPAVVQVDAGNGFAHPAIEFATPALLSAAKTLGMAAMSVTRSYSPGILGHVIEPLAEAGFLALLMSNSPPNVAAWGGCRKVFGTNPLAFAVPRANKSPLVLDMATSAVTKVALTTRAKSGEALPLGWAHDADGHPTIDPKAALAGSIAPLGGAKGAGLLMMVEILAAGLAGANWSRDVSLYANDLGGPPGVGQLLIAFDPGGFSPGFAERLDDLLVSMLDDPGVRLPGDRRLEARARAIADGVEVASETLAWLKEGS
jgi:(2R)-3-sulfolactate dehydrogenase (NADP+)